MHTKITTISFRVGLVVFFLAALTLLTKGGSFIIVFTHFALGLVYGFVLAAFHEQNTTATWKQVAFIGLSTILHLLCAFGVDFLNEDKAAPIRILSYSILGFCMLKLCYDFFFSKKASFLYTLVFPFVFEAIGIAH